MDLETRWELLFYSVKLLSYILWHPSTVLKYFSCVSHSITLLQLNKSWFPIRKTCMFSILLSLDDDTFTLAQILFTCCVPGKLFCLHSNGCCLRVRKEVALLIIKCCFIKILLLRLSVSYYRKTIFFHSNKFCFLIRKRVAFLVIKLCCIKILVL